MYKRKAGCDPEGAHPSTEYLGGRCTQRRLASQEEETMHRMRIEYQQMAEALRRCREEKSEIINEAGKEISRLRKEKENVINQSVGEITRLRRDMDSCHQVARKVECHVKNQESIIEFLRISVARAESKGVPKSSFNHVGAF